MDWKESYNKKLVSVEDAAAKIESGDRVWINCTTAIPKDLCDAIADNYLKLKDVNMFSALNIYPLKFYTSSEYIGHINYHSLFLGPYERAYERAGNVDLNSVQFSKVGQYVMGHGPDQLNLDTFISDATPPDEDGYMYFGTMGVAAGLIWEATRKRIIQVNSKQYKVSAKHGHRIHVDDVDWICEKDHEVPEFPKDEPSAVDKAIAGLLLPYIPDGACLQIGLGGLANAIGYGITGKKDLSVHTEMFTDSMLQMVKSGALTGKKYAGFGVGSHELCSYIAEGNVELGPIWEVNNPITASKNDNFIAINSCLMSDLTGQICSESIGHRNYSGIGGQMDYIRTASLSNGGKSFLCMSSTSTDKKGTVRSNIVLNLPLGAVVTTPRTEVMYAATEYGVANIYNKSIPERAELLIGIAHPDFRAQLRSEARAVGILRK